MMSDVCTPDILDDFSESFVLSNQRLNTQNVISTARGPPIKENEKQKMLFDGMLK